MSSGKKRNRRKAVEDYADISRESYRTVVGRAFAARESNLRLSRDFFERTVAEIQEQTRLSRCASQKLVGHAGKQGEALGKLAGGAAGVYEEFPGSPPKDTRR